MSSNSRAIHLLPRSGLLRQRTRHESPYVSSRRWHNRSCAFFALFLMPGGCARHGEAAIGFVAAASPSSRAPLAQAVDAFPKSVRNPTVYLSPPFHASLTRFMSLPRVIRRYVGGHARHRQCFRPTPKGHAVTIRNQLKLMKIEEKTFSNRNNFSGLSFCCDQNSRVAPPLSVARIQRQPELSRFDARLRPIDGTPFHPTDGRLFCAGR